MARTTAPKPNVIIKREPLVFKYWNGERNACVEPIQVLMEIQRRLGSEFLDEANYSESDDLSIEDCEKITKQLEVFRSIFKLKDIEIDDNGNVIGLGTTEVFELIADFMIWTNEIKKKQSHMPTSLKSMGQKL